MDYAAWQKTVPDAIKHDPLWRVEAYRLALFAAYLGWYDVTNLMSDRRTLSLSDQLYPDSAVSVVKLLKAIPVVPGAIGPGFMNTHWDLREKAGIGITMVDIF